MKFLKPFFPPLLFIMLCQPLLAQDKPNNDGPTSVQEALERVINRAKEYQKLADSERKNAEEASHKVPQDFWMETAQKSKELAEMYQKESDKFKKEAEELAKKNGGEEKRIQAPLPKEVSVSENEVPTKPDYRSGSSDKENQPADNDKKAEGSSPGSESGFSDEIGRAHV